MEGKSWQRGLSSFAEGQRRTWLAQHKWVHERSLTPLVPIPLSKVINKQAWNPQSSLWWPCSRTCADVLSCFSFSLHSTSDIAHFGGWFCSVFLNRGNYRNSRCYCAFIPGWRQAGTGSQQWRDLHKVSAWICLSQESAALGEKAFWDGSCCPIYVPMSCPPVIHSPGMLLDELMIQLAPSQGLLRF